MEYIGAIKRNFQGINDSTLREGEQFKDAVFSLNDQKTILNLLYTIGVDSAEVGNPIVPGIFEDLKSLSKIKKRPPLMAHIRNKKTDLEFAINSGVDGVHIICASDPERLRMMSTTLDNHIEELVNNIKLAKSKKLKIRVSVEHGLERSFFRDSLKIIKVADKLNVDRVQLADTRGVLLPIDVNDAVEFFRENIKVQIGVHFHNDLGHAVSNAMEALASGANWVDTTLLGIGERTGICPLSSILVNLCKIDKSLSKRYSIKSIFKAENELASILNIKIPHNLITSPNAFSHKAGIHINGIKKQGAKNYEAINPNCVGNFRVIVSDSRISGKSNNSKQ